MLDTQQIQELHFRTYQFDNSPNGKMLLGILFATSKQYSDKLSIDVARGVRGAISEGKYVGQFKKGYVVDASTGYFQPDAHNWKLLRRGALMRLEDRATSQEVADFLNASHFSYRKYEEDEYRVFNWTKQKVLEVLTDPFYAGIYKYGDNLAKLTELYNFTPLLSVDEFVSLNRSMADNFNEEFKGRFNVAKRLDFGLLRNKVICDFCDEKMVFQRTRLTKGQNAGKYTLSFYCRNKQCIRHHPDQAMAKYGKKLSRSIRVKYLSAAIEWALSHCTENVAEAYKFKMVQLMDRLAENREIAKRKLADAKKDLVQHRARYAKFRNLQLDDPKAYATHHKGMLEMHLSLMNNSEQQVKELELELQTINEGLPTPEKFVELIQLSLKKLLETDDILEEDAIYQEYVLNLRAGDNVISDIRLNPPYDLMVDLTKVFHGGRYRT